MQPTEYMSVLRIQLPAFNACRILVAPQLGNDGLEKGMPLEKGKALVVAHEAGSAWWTIHKVMHTHKTYFPIMELQQNSREMAN